MIAEYNLGTDYNPLFDRASLAHQGVRAVVDYVDSSVKDYRTKDYIFRSKGMSLTVIKFSSEDCGLCHKMSFYDQKVAAELGLEFVDVKMQDTATYRKYRKILLTQYPDKSEMGWPTYIICQAPEDESFKIVGEVKGAHPKGEFRTKLQEVVAQLN